MVARGQIKNINKYLLIGILGTLSIVMHWPHFQKELVSIHVWRQVETQTTIQNFYREDFNILNPRLDNRGNGSGIHRMEFPLMQWLTACLYRIFGEHLIITRIFMFLIGLFTLAGMYELVHRIFNRKLPAVIAALTLNFSPGFYYYTINPMPDNFALCCSVWGLAIFFSWIRNQKYFYLVVSCLLLSVGALSKLPFILYFLIPWMYFITKDRKLKSYRMRTSHLIAVLVPVFLPLAWYVMVIPGWSGNPVVLGILHNDTPMLTLADYLQHNLVSTLPEILMGYGALPLFLAGIFFLIRNRIYRHELFPVYLVWGIALIAYFLFEINSIGKAHDYYLFPFYPALFILVGYGAEKLIESKTALLKILCFLLILSSPVFCYARMQGRWDLESPGFNVNLLKYREELRNAIPDNALCVAGNDESHRIFLYYIDKKGWTFSDDKLDPSLLRELIGKGARYLYSDSRFVDENPAINSLLGDRVLQKGSIRIYRLRTESGSTE